MKNEGAQIIDFAEAKKELLENQNKKKIKTILEQELPEREGYNNFGLGSTREDLIEEIFKILFLDEKNENFLNSIKAQISFDADIDHSEKEKLVQKLSVVFSRCKGELAETKLT